MRKVAAAVALLTLAALSGCGTATTVTLSRFDSGANSICRELSANQAELAQRAIDWRRAGRTRLEIAEKGWQEEARIARVADSAVSRLLRPRAQAGVIGRLVTGYFSEAEYELELAHAVTERQFARLLPLGEALAHLTREDATVALELGLVACDKLAAARPKGEAL